MMGVAQAYNDYYDETAFIGARLSLPILSIKERELLSRQPLLTFKEEVVSQHLSAQPIVTVDSDGQHLIKDIVRVAKATEENPESSCLGCACLCW